MKKIFALILALALCLSLCACGGVDQRYTALIEYLDNHEYELAAAEVAMLRQQAIDNGDIVVVEPQDKDYDLVYSYDSIARNLMNYSPDRWFSVYDSDTETSYQGNDGLAYCYAKLQALEGVDEWLTSEYFEFDEGFPTDRTALLNRFTIVEDQLVKTNRSTVDNMGNTGTNEGDVWYYDANGILVTKYVGWNSSRTIWEDLYSKSGYYRYTYNDAGLITETKVTDQENTSVYAQIIPTYDASGNVLSETITDNNGQYVFNYAYDANGNRTEMTYSDDWYDYAVVYTYDNAGNLIQKDRYSYDDLNDEQIVSFQKTTVYNRDAAGSLVSATVTAQDFNWRWVNGGYEIYVYSEKVNTASYTNDDQGRLIQEIWQYGETVYEDGETQKPDYTTETIDYVYGDYYIFN